MEIVIPGVKFVLYKWLCTQIAGLLFVFMSECYGVFKGVKNSWLQENVKEALTTLFLAIHKATNLQRSYFS